MGVFIVNNEEVVEGPEILMHQFLLIFVKVYVDFLISVQQISKEILEKVPIALQQIHRFPIITAPEAHFISYVLMETEEHLGVLLRFSPLKLISNPIFSKIVVIFFIFND